VLNNIHIRRSYYLCLCTLIFLFKGNSQQLAKDNFLTFVNNTQSQIYFLSDTQLETPTDEDLRLWAKAFYYFRARSLDSCKSILSQQNYSLTQMADHRTGNMYDIIKENIPIKKGWGTFIFNRQRAKRLFVHVTHPADDAYVMQIGAELFRSTRAEWFYIGGTRKNNRVQNIPLDPARNKRSLFQHWHEIFTDLTHISISLHGFDKNYYRSPISDADVVLSNGKTSDDQWGISQISLAYRDSLRSSGFATALAMYDSGFASLSWGISPQGIFSNDSVGFGHWLNIELSKEIRNNPLAYAKFIASTDKALEVTGKKISQQVNRAFGLVSPRSVRLGSRQGMLFPPSTNDTYRIVSFNAGVSKRDTIDIRMGSWLQFPGSSRSISEISQMDSSDESIVQMLRTAKKIAKGTSITNIVRESPSDYSSLMHLRNRAIKDSSLYEESEKVINKPLQVHRIPLRRRAIVSTDRLPSDITPYHWQGSVSKQFPLTTYLQFGDENIAFAEEEEMPDFLIPIINRTYKRHDKPFVGLKMSHMLAQHIARLVTEHSKNPKQIELLAEVTDTGDYFLRIFPSSNTQQIAQLIK